MSHALKIWTLLTGSIRYEKTISTRNRGQGWWIEAPILAYLIETSNGRILYDVGCDYRKLTNPALGCCQLIPMDVNLAFRQITQTACMIEM